MVHPTQDLIFVADAGGRCRIKAFRQDGTFLFQWSTRDSTNKNYRCLGQLALHPTRDLLFVADVLSYQVQVFDLEGSFVGKWGSKGKGDKEFFFPSGVAVDSTSDVVYISNSDRIQACSLFNLDRKYKKNR